MPRLSKIGAAALAAFGWTGLSSVTASYLVVAGGGGGGKRVAGAGGAGGYRTGTTSLNPTLSYAVTVGAGGAGGAVYTVAGTSGNNSVFNDITSAGGGGGAGSSISNGVSGGSGGGSSDAGTAGSGNTPSTSPSQGSNGGVGSGTAPNYGGGGGGGASAVGGSGSSTVAGNGGAGTASSISGSSVTYAGGGGGGSNGGTAGTGGSGGGGAGTTSDSTATAGTANLGGGGGGCGGLSTSSGTTFGGQGGSGVVIISYVGAQQFGGGIVTSSGGSTIHTFTTSGTLSPLSSLTASSLVVAGGGGGGFDRAGGGGAGGFRTGSGLTIDTNSIYLVTVGAGGSGSSSGANKGSSGSDSVFLSITSTGGGGGGSSSNAVGANGGSGGGSRDTSSGGAGSGNTPSTSPSQGNNGGSFGDSSGSTGGGGGGGGAGAVGNAGKTVGTGIGGAGTASSISGSSVTYAGGGGGGGSSGAGSAAGGAGGGGAGGGASTAGTAGTANLGGGGGGGGDGSGTGGTGGSGIVIISYPGSTQQMAGGTVTVAGGNVIHTFTSSGFLTPIVLTTNSLRFRASASAFLNRTPASAGNRRTWTWSGWVKRGALTTASGIMSAGTSANDWTGFRFNSDDTFAFYRVGPGGGTTTYLNTTQVFRDPSSWYHIVLQWDTTQATSSDRIKLYVNGVQVTAFASSSYPSQNYEDSFMNTAVAHLIGNITSVSQYFDGYMAELNFIDGQQLTPFSFGTTSDLGVWQPIRYGGSYGTNGFYLKFTDTTNTTTLGYDSSPNSNNWTTNNISLTAGSTYDSMTDVPTLTSATTANYAVMNPLVKVSNTTLSNGNLTFTKTGNSDIVLPSTIAMPSGKFYWETTLTSVSSGSNIGLGLIQQDAPSAATGTWPGASDAAIVLFGGNGNLYVNGTGLTGTGVSLATNDVVGLALDMSAATLALYKNGSLVYTATSLVVTKPYLALFNSYGNGESQAVNFGQRPFAYTPPSGFLQLNTFNLPTPTIGATAATTANKYMDVVLYSGNNSTQNIAVGFQPDWVWSKCRNVGRSHRLSDAVRGSTRDLYSDTTDDEDNNGSITAFISTGFSLDNATGSTYNTSGENYVSWAWKANGAGSSNTAGSITSTVSASTTAGFSIVTYSANGSTGTVGHGLGVTPSMIIVKKRNAAERWCVFHTSTSNAYIYLNETFAADTTNANVRFGNNTVVVQPTSTLFTIGNSNDVNGTSGTYVAYCFAPIAGYSAFGSYTGNGSTDGPFVFTGFRPRFVMVKESSASGNNWVIYDTARDTYNECSKILYSNLSNAEFDGSTVNLDILSNGFKPRDNWGGNNNSGNTYIYMAFAENPFKYANAR